MALSDSPLPAVCSRFSVGLTQIELSQSRYEKAERVAYQVRLPIEMQKSGQSSVVYSSILKRCSGKAKLRTLHVNIENFGIPREQLSIESQCVSKPFNLGMEEVRMCLMHVKSHPHRPVDGQVIHFGLLSDNITCHCMF